MNAIILAGDKQNSPLKKFSSNKSLLKIKGKLMVEYIIDALKQVEIINKIVVVGPREEELEKLKGKVDKIIFCTESIFEKAEKGISHLKETGEVLILSSDIPMVTPESIEDFIDKTKQKEGDLFYPIIKKADSEKKYPGAKRTYVKLKNGLFTGGNLIVVKGSMVKESKENATKILENRKKPIMLAKILGWGFVFKLIAGRLIIQELENRVSVLLGLRAVALVSSYPEIGTDIDKISDLELANKVLSI